MALFNLVCFISARNLGDAVIHADFIKKLNSLNYTNRWIIWTFPQAIFVFDEIKNCDIICSSFPMGATIKNFFKGGFLSFLKAIKLLRQLKPDITLDVIGDFREKFSCWIIGAKINFSPEWETGHPFRNHAYMLPFRKNRLLTIPVSKVNIYDAQTSMLYKLTSKNTHEKNNFNYHKIDTKNLKTIGIHPCASTSFKLWPNLHWAELLAMLWKRFPKTQFILFGSPSERTQLEQLASMVTVPHEIFTSSLQEFKNKMAKIDLLVGLDSFSVHMAHSLGVPSIVLFGANDARIFSSPSSIPIFHPGYCKFQPCGGRPQCIRTDFQYACMKAITPSEVMKSI
jgi:heptosyltransferase III